MDQSSFTSIGQVITIICRIVSLQLRVHMVSPIRTYENGG